MSHEYAAFLKFLKFRTTLVTSPLALVAKMHLAILKACDSWTKSTFCYYYTWVLYISFYFLLPFAAFLTRLVLVIEWKRRNYFLLEQQRRLLRSHQLICCKQWDFGFRAFYETVAHICYCKQASRDANYKTRRGVSLFSSLPSRCLDGGYTIHAW